ncbi:MAG TPA: hypothetical protein VJN43_10030 [Bryobacteraceae bacterium]|nr:hypothetical protein [Bryobacteraceae bacterium]
MVHRLGVILFLLPLALAESFQTPKPAAPKDFAVMAWGQSPSDPAQLDGMRQAGLNISGFCRAEDVARVQAASLTCFVSDPTVEHYDLLHLPPDAEIRRHVTDLKKEVGDNPAALGFYLRDEPDAPSMPGLGKLAEIFREAMPDKWPYVNLFPYRVSPDRLGTKDYDSYVRMLVKTIGQPFLSYDNYSLVNGDMLDYFYVNLEIVRRLSLETGAPFWNCILANSHFNYMEPSDATFNLQVYSTMAYGGRGIQYFTYFAPEIGNYRLAPVDQFGNRTATWDMLRRINNQIHALAPTLIGLHSTGVYHYPDVPEQGQPLTASKLIQRVEMTQRYVRPPVAGRFLIGEFADNHNRPYFLIVNKDLRNSFQFQIDLKQEGRKLVRISPYSGKEEPFGREMDWLAPGAGILFRIE